VLVIRLDGIGDMVLFHGAFCHYPAALGVSSTDITLLGCESWASLAPTFFPGCQFYPIAEHAYDRRPFYRFKVSLWVRRRGFAITICDMYMRKPLAADSLVYVSGAPRRIVAKPNTSPKTKRLFDWYLARCQQVIDTGCYPTHEIVRHFRFLSALASQEIGPVWPALPRSPRVPPLVSAYAVLNLGSNEPGRRWPTARFLGLAEYLASRGLLVVFVGGANEAALAKLVAAAAHASPWGSCFVDRINSTTLPELLDLLQYAAVVVSSDTGPAHLAIGLGAPTVVIVGGGHFTSFVPYPPEITPRRVRFVWHELACYHCFWACTQPHNPGESFPCLYAVELPAVQEAAEQLLTSQTGYIISPSRTHQEHL
jgi:ADP-heptose:LPS heptosyltransferase